MQLAGRRVGFLVAGFLAIGLLGSGLYWQFVCPASRVAIDYRNADTVALGKKVYAERCSSCHGARLEGQLNWRERHANGRPPAPPHDESGHAWHHSDQQLFELTEYGPAAFVGGNYESDMPGFEGVLTDRELRAVLAFIKSTWPNQIRERHDQINERAGS